MKCHKNKEVTLLNAFMLPTVLVTALLILILISFMAIIQFQKTRHLYEKQLELAHRLFTENISQGILLGQYPKVYGQCKTFLSEEYIHQIMIVDSLGHTVCDVAKSNDLNIGFTKVSTVQFEVDGLSAATITITYEIGQIQKQFYSIVFVSTLLWISMLLFFVFVFKKISFLIVSPINELEEVLSTGDLSKMKGFSLKDRLFKIKEVNDFAANFKQMALQIIELKKIEAEKEKQQAINLIALQVSHDIRSPIAVLNMVLNDLTNLPEELRHTIRSVTNRINDIANQLLKRGRQNPQSIEVIDLRESKEPCFISQAISSIIAEKRIQYRNYRELDINFNFENGYGAFADVNATELSRVVSNLINNSFEALKGKGTISVKVWKTTLKVKLSIEDNGPGIPKQILEKIGQFGISYGKNQSDSGTGIGLYHAVNTVEKFNGTLNIRSHSNEGTTIDIEFPQEVHPSWFVPYLEIKKNQHVIILDRDNDSIIFWARFFKDYQVNLNLFCTLTDIENWISRHLFEIKDTLFLINEEILNEQKNGNTLVEKYCLPNLLLITNGNEEIYRKLSVSHIPKSMLGLVPIIFETNDFESYGLNNIDFSESI